MPKNIVVLSDGTGQIGGKGHDTNVYKLFRMLADRTDDQIVFYDEGVGTEEQRLTGMAFGTGFDKNILQCYRFIFDNYKSGDKLFFFGFSRGAATVRSLASFIHYFGILPMSRPELIEQAYRLYERRKQPKRSEKETKGVEDKRTISQKVADRTFKTIDKAAYSLSQFMHEDLDEKSTEFVHQHPNQWAKVEFLGVWDTVPALGLVPLPGLDSVIERLPAWRHQYHDFKLHPSVKNAYHALSIDDDRKWFFPTVWKDYDPTEQKVEQVWFGGAHTDVGGGFWEAGFSDIALEWMVQKALQHGIKLYLGSRRYWNFCVAPDATDLIQRPRSGPGRIYAFGERNDIWDGQAYEVFGPPRIHETVLERADHDKNYRPWILTNYPEPEKVDDWLKKNYPEYLNVRYLSESQKDYEKWCLEIPNPNGQIVLPTLKEWRAQPENSYETWLSNSNSSFEEWMRANVEEFKGKRILVERVQPVVLNDTALRDYDRTSLAEKMKTILEDALAFDRLLVRARKKAPKLSWWDRARKREPQPDLDRTRYDADRWTPHEPDPPQSGAGPN
jgi:uncharacterized protein (DUF2235 family)